jgi:hypothetical protein
LWETIAAAQLRDTSVRKGFFAVSPREIGRPFAGNCGYDFSESTEPDNGPATPAVCPLAEESGYGNPNRPQRNVAEPVGAPSMTARDLCRLDHRFGLGMEASTIAGCERNACSSLTMFIQ